MTRPSSADYAAIFGNNLRAARLRAGLKQSEIAQRTGSIQQQLSLIEAGRQNVTLRVMVALADCVGCSLPEMLAGAFEITRDESDD